VPNGHDSEKKGNHKYTKHLLEDGYLARDRGGTSVSKNPRKKHTTACMVSGEISSFRRSSLKTGKAKSIARKGIKSSRRDQ